MAVPKGQVRTQMTAAPEIDTTSNLSGRVSTRFNTPFPANHYAESKDAVFSATHGSTPPFGPPRRPDHASFNWRQPFSLYTIVFISHLLLTLCPCLFLILSFSAWAVNNDPVTSHRGQIVEQAARVGPTLFPIIFAAVCGRLMKTYALWRAEKGETLGILEQMNGSQNLMGALERAVLLPGLGFMSTGIVLLWLLSPIGGQSSLRVLGRGISTTTGNAPLYYFNTSTTAGGTAFEGAAAYAELGSSINAVFQAALTSLERVTGRDTWGNVKIPVLQYLGDHAGIEGWVEFDENSYHDPYSALNGLVISGLRDGVNFNFTLESSYFNLTCSGPVFFNTTSSVTDMGGFDEWGRPFITHTTANGSFEFSSPMMTKGGWNSYMVDTNYNQTANYDHMVREDPEPQYNIIYASTFGAGRYADVVVAAYNCTVGKTYVESDLLCTGSSCQVRRIRSSRRFGPSYSGWPWPTLDPVIIGSLLGWLGSATTLESSLSASPIDAYVSGSNTPFNSQQDVNYQNVTTDDVSKRLQSLVNTGWQLAYQGSATAQQAYGNLTALASVSDGENSTQLYKIGMTYPFGSTLATTVTTTQIFVVHRVWLSVNVIISLILLFCGISGMLFKYKSNCPDIFGFVSSLTRDNPDFEQVPGGDKLDGLERARVMRHVRVQIVDIAPWGEGHITLKNVDTDVSVGEMVQ